MTREEALELLNAAKANEKLCTFSKVTPLMTVGEYINAVTRTVANYPSTHTLNDQLVVCVQQAVQNKRKPAND